MCNPRYRGRVQTDGNVCVGNSRQDVWCLLSSAFSTGKYYLLLANDGSVSRTTIAGIPVDPSPFLRSTPQVQGEGSPGGPRWSIEPSAARVGQVCVHRGTFPASEDTIWCSPDLKDAFENPALPVEHIPGGVRLNHTRHTVLRHCSFRRMGGIGLEINGGSQHTAVQGCWVSDVSGTGLLVGGNDECPHCPDCAKEGRVCPQALSPLMDFNLSVTDTVISDVAQEYMGELGVRTGFTRRLLFAHNTVCRTNWGAMSFGNGVR